MRCPTCGSDLDAEAQANACRGCPLSRRTEACRLGLVRCPSCGYHSLLHEVDRSTPQGADENGREAGGVRPLS